MENTVTKPNPAFILKYFKKYSLLLVFGALFLVFAKVSTTIEPIYLRNIINALSGNNFNTISSILIIFFGLKILSIFFEFLRDTILAPVIMGVTRDVELSVFDKLLRLPSSYHADQKAGEATRAVARGARAISMMLDFTITQLLPPVFELVFVSIVLFNLFSWQFGAITLATIGLYAWFTIWATEKRQVLRMAGNVQEDLSSGIFVESITNIDTVKYFNSARQRFDAFLSIKNKWFSLFVKNNRLFALIFSAQGIILWIGLGIIFVLAIGEVHAGVMTVGDVVLVSTYIIQLSIPITTLGFIYGQFKNSFSDLKAMGKIIAQEETIPEPEYPISPKRIRGEVEFHSVSFKYSDAQASVLQNVNLRVSPGQKVAFVGPSGAGKSTIVKLLFRLFDTTGGRVVIDGVDVRKLSQNTRKKIMAIVPQDPALFNDSIATNIKFGKPSATLSDIRKASRVAQIDKFISRLPNGYDTIVGERGVKLSGGERQRVAIARAVLANPKILVFDEATSNLDTKNEQAITRTLRQASRGRTTVAIAHRLSTIIDSDVIYVISKGNIAEQGSHAQLIKLNGIYARLWRMQSKSK